MEPEGAIWLGDGLSVFGVDVVGQLVGEVELNIGTLKRKVAQTPNHNNRVAIVDLELNSVALLRQTQQLLLLTATQMRLAHYSIYQVRLELMNFIIRRQTGRLLWEFIALADDG